LADKTTENAEKVDDDSMDDENWRCWNYTHYFRLWQWKITTNSM
jgi:hypothetical protein